MVLSGIVLKIASRCNLNCSYCYMYNKGDDSFMKQPKFMSRLTMMHVVSRIEEYCIQHNEKRFLVIFHGGEPLLASKELYRYFVSECRKCQFAQIDFALQTNGVLLDLEWCELFNELGIQIGISLDGTQDSHDQYRLYHSGKGSFNDILTGLAIYRSINPEDLSVITVMNIEYNPIEIYNFYKKIGVKRWNILLPDYTHEDKPSWLQNTKSTDWSDKIIPLFDLWINDSAEERVSINIFKTIITLILGLENAGDDHFGMRANNTLVVETDGGIEATDPLKACGNGFTKEGLNISTNSFDQALTTPLAKAYINSHQNLCAQCNACPVRDTCGGGYLVHRFSQDSAFDNPSVYCANLKKLIVHIHNFLISKNSALSEHLRPLDFEMVLNHYDTQILT